MATQSVRRSQFITTYGPGAILEGAQGPRIIPTLDQSGLFDNRRPVEFEITDLRLSQALLNGAGILRLPSNAELGRPDADSIYDTKRFPAWSLCVKHGLLYHKTRDDNRACPRCDPLPDKYEAWRQAQRQAIRFVRACPDGHLDDVDWVGIIEHRHDNCSPSYLYWRGGGGALRHVSVECPNCGASMNLGIAYSREWRCSGRFPEQGSPRPGCDKPSKIIQRGAANLRIPELQTALTIPPRSTRLHRLLEMTVVRAVLLTQPIHNKEELVIALKKLIKNGLLNEAVLIEIQSHSDDAIRAAIQDTIEGSLPDTLQTLRLQEFEALQYAAAHGAPPQPSLTPGAPPQFEVVRTQVRALVQPNGHILRITPVNRLRVVMVQTGYRRLDPLLGNPVDCIYQDDQGRNWYPGVELFGEGVFVDLVPGNQEAGSLDHFPLRGAAADTWFDAWLAPDQFEQRFHAEERDQLHPVFVWWHTFSHRLINALAVDSGYSSAAVRERVFVHIDQDSGEASGGVLLYTAQPGGDGTLGGLAALVPEFERVISTAFRNLEACSNDPLCGEERFGPGKYNGSACYACALISETSCEHRNMRLDRNLLLDNLP
jgi:ribosomal protein S27AE